MRPSLYSRIFAIVLRGNAFLVLLGVSMFFWGTVSNISVVEANRGIMPVYTKAVIVQDGRHELAITFAHVTSPILADQFEFESMGTRSQPLTSVRILGDIVGYPSEPETSILSIGDIMRWVGSGVFFLSFPPFLGLLGVIFVRFVARTIIE